MNIKNQNNHLINNIKNKLKCKMNIGKKKLQKKDQLKSLMILIQKVIMIGLNIKKIIVKDFSNKENIFKTKIIR